MVQSYATAALRADARVAVRSGEWVLCLCAGGGVGLAAVDVARTSALASWRRRRGPTSLPPRRRFGEEAGVNYDAEDLKAPGA